MAANLSNQSCDGTPLRLAEGGIGRVTACPCGNIHFDVEYVTMRFAPDAFRALVEMLASARQKLDAVEAQSQATSLGEAARSSVH